MQQAQPIQGLTTTKAPFIENAKNQGDLFIRQPYELYNQDNHIAWRKLYTLLLPKWEKYACQKFLNGLSALCLNQEEIPKLEDVNKRLVPLTGFQAKAVTGYVPAHIFFERLMHGEFPTTITIRDSNSLNYLPEPDIFHDIAGHVPMHTDRTFANVLIKFGALTLLAADRHAKEGDLEKLRSNIQAISRFFWFTIEFGLIQENHRLSVYGSGLLSSAAEIEHCVESSEVQRFPFQLEWVINQSFEIDRFQALLFVIDSFEQLYEEMHRLEQWLMEGKLDHVSPGAPAISDEELALFLNSSEGKL